MRRKFDCMDRRKSKLADPDRLWKLENAEIEENALYKYLNNQNGGKLIDCYTEAGEEAVEKMLSSEIEPFLYNGGKGKVLTKLEFVQWRNRSSAKRKGQTLIDTRSEEEVLNEFKDTFEPHLACWDINKRGVLGETALHICCLHDTPIHFEIAKILVRLYPKMVLDIYEGVEYYGQSALHLAVVSGNLDMVKLLVEHGAMINQRASGPFFLPEDVKLRKKTVSTSNYAGYAYFGEYALAFAACFGREDIYDYLTDNGADPNLKDTLGNCVLHMLVISNQLVSSY